MRIRMRMRSMSMSMSINVEGSIGLSLRDMDMSAFMRYLDVRFSVGVYISDDVGLLPLLMNILTLHICQYCSLMSFLGSPSTKKTLGHVERVLGY